MTNENDKRRRYDAIKTLHDKQLKEVIALGEAGQAIRPYRGSGDDGEIRHQDVCDAFDTICRLRKDAQKELDGLWETLCTHPDFEEFRQEDPDTFADNLGRPMFDKKQVLH